MGGLQSIGTRASGLLCQEGTMRVGGIERRNGIVERDVPLRVFLPTDVVVYIETVRL